VAAAVGALQRHLEKERSGKNALFDDDDMFSLVRFLSLAPAASLVLAAAAAGCAAAR
jgi:hypothetical protein